jgi:hypothetical protein
MTEAPKYFGLCQICEHDPTCMLRRSPQLEIVQCEEFSIQPVVQKLSPVSEESFIDSQEAKNMGLCANCLNVVTCCFPNARRGVLQCEEYILDETGVIPPIQSVRSQSAA